jgi:hypothetical protein
MKYWRVSNTFCTQFQGHIMDPYRDKSLKHSYLCTDIFVEIT